MTKKRFFEKIIGSSGLPHNDLILDAMSYLLSTDVSLQARGSREFTCIACGLKIIYRNEGDIRERYGCESIRCLVIGKLGGQHKQPYNEESYAILFELLEKLNSSESTVKSSQDSSGKTYKGTAASSDLTIKSPPDTGKIAQLPHYVPLFFNLLALRLRLKA